MKRVVAGILTVALMAWLVRSGLDAPPAVEQAGTPPGTESKEADPLIGAEARVRSLLTDASDGDVSGYLGAFAPGLRARIGREVEEKGREAFAGSLRGAAGARKGHAVFAPEPDGPDAARVVVESVYPDRNERQTYRLERVGGGWLVADVETVRASRPKVKFGDPASFREPEGVPVPVAAPGDVGEPPME